MSSGRQQGNWIIRIAGLICILTVIFIIFQTQLHRLKSDSPLPLKVSAELRTLALKALESEDVPVAALVLYREEIIGRGYNTVYKDHNVAGHGEINAVNDAAGSMGMEAFMKLDRKELYLISTFEPCEMCKGTLNHYGIRNVGFLKDKSLFQWIKSYGRSVRYEMLKRQTEGEPLQDSLFLLHPRYPGR